MERASEPVLQHCVARAMPTDAANDHVRRRQDCRDETDEDGQGDHAAGSLRDPDRHAEWLRAVREAASADGYRLVINARVDVFLGPFLAGAGPGTQEELFPEALRRANPYVEAGVDCVYPIALWETDALRASPRRSAAR